MPFVSSTPQTGENILRDNASDAAEIASSKPRIELRDLVPPGSGSLERDRELERLRADRSYNEATGLLELHMKRPDGTYGTLQLDPKYLVDAPPPQERSQPRPQVNPHFRVSPQPAQYPEHPQYRQHQTPAPPAPPAPPSPQSSQNAVVQVQNPMPPRIQYQEEPHDWSPPRNRGSPASARPVEVRVAPCSVEEQALSLRLEDIDYEIQKNPDHAKHQALLIEKERIIARLEFLAPRRDTHREVHPCEVPRVTMPAQPRDRRQAANDAHAIWQHFGVKSTRSPGYWGGMPNGGASPRGASYPVAGGSVKHPVQAPSRQPQAAGQVKMPVPASAHGSSYDRHESTRSSSRHRRRRSSPDGASRSRRSSPDGTSRRRRRSTSRG